MKIVWNRVTWYSWVVAVIVFGAAYFIGMYMGMQIEEQKLIDSALNPSSSTVTVTPASHQ